MARSSYDSYLQGLFPAVTETPQEPTLPRIPPENNEQKGTPGWATPDIQTLLANPELIKLGQQYLDPQGNTRTIIGDGKSVNLESTIRSLAKMADIDLPEDIFRTRSNSFSVTNTKATYYYSGDAHTPAGQLTAGGTHPSKKTDGEFQLVAMQKDFLRGLAAEIFPGDKNGYGKLVGREGSQHQLHGEVHLANGQVVRFKVDDAGGFYYDPKKMKERGRETATQGSENLDGLRLIDFRNPDALPGLRNAGSVPIAEVILYVGDKPVALPSSTIQQNLKNYMNSQTANGEQSSF